MGSIFEMDAGWLRIIIIAWALFRILLEVSIRLSDYNSEKRNPGLIILNGLLYLLTLAALIVSPLMCIFDVAVEHFTLKRFGRNVEESTREEILKLYHIPPYDKPRF